MDEHKRAYDWYYVYSFRTEGSMAGYYVYERTCGTEDAAKEWVVKYGYRAVYLVNDILRNAFY